MLFGIPMGPELIVIVMILFVFVLPILGIVALVRYVLDRSGAVNEERVAALERRVEQLEDDRE